MRDLLTRRRLALLAATPLLLGGLVACGSDSDKASDAAASSSTSASESPAVDQPEAGDTVDPQEFGDMLLASLDDATTAQISMKIDSTGMQVSATGAVDYSTEPANMALEMETSALGGGTIEMRMVDNVMYMKMPMLPVGDKFIKVDLDDPNNPMAGSMGDIGSFDPRSQLDGFTKGVQSVKVVGTESIDGDEATHYLVTVDTKSLSAEVGKAAGQVNLPKQITYDAWIDTDGHLRKMTADLGPTASIEMQMNNWGEPVDISAPPASEVTEMPGM